MALYGGSWPCMALFGSVRSCMALFIVLHGPMWSCTGPLSGLHKTGIRGIQDTRQIVDSNTNDIENNDKKGGSRFHNIRQLMKKVI